MLLDVPGDCKEPTCVGGMVGSTRRAPSDKPPEDGNMCHMPACSGSMPTPVLPAAGIRVRPFLLRLRGRRRLSTTHIGLQR